MRIKNKIIYLVYFLACPAILTAQQQRCSSFKEKYQLKEVVVLSRHNIRSPLSGRESLLGKMTPHTWISWSAGTSELTLRGGVLETMMGQYFRKWLVDEGMFHENHVPTTDEVNIYANSMQRTVATAQYFTSGFMPLANLKINHRFTPSKMDPIFAPVLTKVTDAFVEEAIKQIDALGSGKGAEQTSQDLTESYRLLTEVLDLSSSPAYQSGKIKDFRDHRQQFLFVKGKEPAMKGSLRTATSASDALVLQYYEERDARKAAFGHNLTADQWQKISEIKDTYLDLLFTAPLVAYNVAHPLLAYLYDELCAADRKFTFLCGHDSNIASVTAALEVEPYVLPQSIEKRTPIGGKLVFEKWTDSEGKLFISVQLVYQTTNQLRNIVQLDLNNPPMIYPLKIKGINVNADGLYRFSDIKKRFEKALNAYESLP